MATFQAQVQALTSFTISSSGTTPTEAELTQFIVDGVNDVTIKWLEVNPEDAKLFATTSTEQTSNAVISDTADTFGVISVMRENGTNYDWVPCKRIPQELQGRVVDPDSLMFASKYNPVYYTNENGIHVFPTPGSTTNAFIVEYVNVNPVQGDGNALTYSSSNIKYFPMDKVYLVVLYAAIKSLKAAAGNEAILEDTELVNTYLGLVNSLTSEYHSAFQTKQPAGQPAGRQQRR